MNYATQVGKPTAHITNKKSRLKVYNGHIVFLKDKDNFEFELHNPKQKSVLVKVKLNGEYISTSGIVLKPGQRVFLERFLDSNNKFEFSTYEVKDTSENRSAIDLNGDVRIEFYDEQTSRNNFALSSGTIYGNGLVYGSRSNDYIPPFGTTISTTGGVGYSTTTSTYNTSNATFTSSVDMNVLRSKKSIETGRVEKGDTSKQSFTNSYQDFNYYTSHEVNFKIQPSSTKNKTTEDIRQYCTECGTKTKTNFKFCPSCGNKL
jgi:Flp pilus assembly protein TadG